MGSEYALFVVLVIGAFFVGGIGAATLARRVYGMRFSVVLLASIVAFIITFVLFGYIYLEGRSWTKVQFIAVAFLTQALAMFLASSRRPANVNRVLVTLILATAETAIPAAVMLAV